MCSIFGCDSSRRGSQLFKLPEDPDRRLEWVQFLFEVNGQQLRESSWTDITICREHFTDQCLDNVTPESATVQLKSGAVPTLCNKAGEVDVEFVGSEETIYNLYQCDYDFKISNSPASYSGKSEGSVSSSSGVSVSFVPAVSNAARPKRSTNIDVKKKAPQQFVVDESCLLQLFSPKCPSCGSDMKMEKVTYGALVVLKQRCLRCKYTSQWKSEVNARIPGSGELEGATGDTPDTQQEVAINQSKETPTDFSEEEDSVQTDEDDEVVTGGSSDDDWLPDDYLLVKDKLTKGSGKETEDEEEEGDLGSPGGLKITQLCTDCGSFFSVSKPHTCEYKIKPFSCNICGKRCSTEVSLKIHNRIHDETYEHPCKYCYVTFRTRADKLQHEQVHLARKDPYKCPDCTETFTTNKKRRAHLVGHRGPKEFTCGVCKITFKHLHYLQRHSVVHTGLKPYVCKVCKRGFNQSNHLRSHMRVHTGERPYQCRHCDKSFNHNVSLKSHVQRYHSSSKKGAAGSDPDFDSTEEQQQSADQKMQEERTAMPKPKMMSTGRPKGRPKRDTEGEVVTRKKKGREKGSNTKNSRSKVQKSKKPGSSREEGEDERSVSDIFFDSAEKEGEERERPQGNQESVP